MCLVTQPPDGEGQDTAALPIQVLGLQGPRARPAMGLAGVLFSLWRSERPVQGKQVLVRPHVCPSCHIRGFRLWLWSVRTEAEGLEAP